MPFIVNQVILVDCHSLSLTRRVLLDPFIAPLPKTTPNGIVGAPMCTHSGIGQIIKVSIQNVLGNEETINLIHPGSSRLGL